MTDALQVFEKIRRATRTLSHLPAVKVRSRFCNWPDFIQRYQDAYGTAPATIRITPTARQLTELDEVIGWLAWLNRYGEEYPLIVWARAGGQRPAYATKGGRQEFGTSWRSIAALVGLSPNTCRERFRVGVCAIAYHFGDLCPVHTKALHALHEIDINEL